MISVFPRKNEKGGGWVGVSVKLYLGAWYMCILHLKSRCAETDSEQIFLFHLCYTLCLCNLFWLNERGEGCPPFPPLGKTLCMMHGPTESNHHITLP